MSRLHPRTVALRRRLLAVLRDADAVELSTKEICARAGLNKFEHHAYAYPQLCALAKLGVITRTSPDPPTEVGWRYNRADQTDEALNAVLDVSRHGGAALKSVAAAAATLLAIAAPAPAAAALITVSPGDRIDTPNVCTIAYTYTGPNDHAYAITAGHCANGKPVSDHSSGATGIFVGSVVDSPRSGGADYGLIDFGPHTFALGFIGNRPVAANGHPQPRPGQTVCRAGITTGQQCGTIAATYGDHQYLTTGMPSSRGGDSGAPVWTISGDGHAQVIGIWLGGRTTAAGQDYGRFAALISAVAMLGVAAAA